MWSFFTKNDVYDKSSSPALPPSEFLSTMNFKILSDASTYGYIFLETSEDVIHKLLFVSKTQKLLPVSNKVTMTTKNIKLEVEFQRRAGTISPKIINTHKMRNSDAIHYINQLKDHLDNTSASAYINQNAVNIIHEELLTHSELQLYVIKMQKLTNYSLSELIIRQDIKTNFNNAYACVLKKMLQLFLDKHCIHMDMHAENIFMSPCSTPLRIFNAHGNRCPPEGSWHPASLREAKQSFALGNVTLPLIKADEVGDLKVQMYEKTPICTCNLIDYGIMFDMNNLQSPAQKGIIQNYRNIMNFNYSADVHDVYKNATKYADLFKLESIDACQVIHSILRIIVGIDLANHGSPQCRDFINFIYGDREYDIVKHPIFDWYLADPTILNRLDLLWNIIVNEQRTIYKLKVTRKNKKTPTKQNKTKIKPRHIKSV